MLHRKLASLRLFIVITSLMNLYRTKVFRSSSFNEIYLDLYVMQHTIIVSNEYGSGGCFISSTPSFEEIYVLLVSFT